MCDTVISFTKFNFPTRVGEVKCFLVWLKNNLQVFLISSEILVKMSIYVSPVCYYFIMITRDMLWHGFRCSLSTAAAGNHVCYTVCGKNKVCMHILSLCKCLDNKEVLAHLIWKGGTRDYLPPGGPSVWLWKNSIACGWLIFQTWAPPNSMTLWCILPMTSFTGGASVMLPKIKCNGCN